MEGGYGIFTADVSGNGQFYEGETEKHYHDGSTSVNNQWKPRGFDILYKEYTDPTPISVEADDFETGPYSDWYDTGASWGSRLYDDNDLLNNPLTDDDEEEYVAVAAGGGITAAVFIGHRLKSSGMFENYYDLDSREGKIFPYALVNSKWTMHVENSAPSAVMENVIGGILITGAGIAFSCFAVVAGVVEVPILTALATSSTAGFAVAAIGQLNSTVFYTGNDIIFATSTVRRVIGIESWYGSTKLPVPTRQGVTGSGGDGNWGPFGEDGVMVDHNTGVHVQVGDRQVISFDVYCAVQNISRQNLASNDVKAMATLSGTVANPQLKTAVYTWK